MLGRLAGEGTGCLGSLGQAPPGPGPPKSSWQGSCLPAPWPLPGCCLLCAGGWDTSLLEGHRAQKTLPGPRPHHTKQGPLAWGRQGVARARNPLGSGLAQPWLAHPAVLAPNPRQLSHTYTWPKASPYLTPALGRDQPKDLGWAFFLLKMGPGGPCVAQMGVSSLPCQPPSKGAPVDSKTGDMRVLVDEPRHSATDALLASLMDWTRKPPGGPKKEA